jgi:hypothetical protein
MPRVDSGEPVEVLGGVEQLAEGTGPMMPMPKSPVQEVELPEGVQP